MITKEKVEMQYSEMRAKGYVKAQPVDQHQLVKMIMQDGYFKKGKIWWFTYELMGHHEIDGERYFMSYKASSRVSELAKEGEVESRQSDGKLHLYALKALIGY